MRDIRAATVETPEVRIVRDAVIDFAKTFDPVSGQPPRHLVMAIKGDFGTGKTHLMLYALSLLEAEIKPEAPSTTGSSPGTAGPTPDEAAERSRALLVVTNEASIEDWYGSVLGPALIKSVRPRELLRELMTKVACAVAEENEKTRHFAKQFREAPQEMFDVLRAADAIDASKVELRFIERLAELVPDADDDFHRCLAALRWTETAPLAERWLACAPLHDEEAKELGAPMAGDCGQRASTFIAAVASICRDLNRPFALFVDEFEHLARHDTRNESQRNITWLKRLIEALARRHAMVFVSGHWKAWEQQGDFLDRFTGRPALQLVRLDTDEISGIVRVKAPGWTRNFLADAAAALADVTSGNIRRVMTVLYDLYAKVGATEELVTPKMVIEAAGQRLHRAPEEGFLGIIDQAVRAKGGILERDAILSGERFDGIARVDGAPRLVIRVLHARDEAALLAEGEKLADHVRTIRRDAPRVRGLFIAVGAVNSKHLRTLDAARTEVDVVDGEDSEIGPEVSKLVTAALTNEAKAEKPQSDAEVEKLREELLQLRMLVLDRSTEQIARAQQEFGKDDRSAAVIESIAPAADDVTRQKAEIERRNVIEKMIADERRVDPLVFLSSIRDPILLLFSGLALVTFAYPLSGIISSASNIPPEGIRNSLIIVGIGCAVMSILSLFQNIVAILRFRRFRLRVIENLNEFGAPPSVIRRARVVMDQAVEKGGPRRAPGRAELMLEKEGLGHAAT